MTDQGIDFHDLYIPEPNSGCWIWIGPDKGNGYGQYKSNGAAHRYSYAMHCGGIEEGMVIDHLCRVPLCVNPAHLEPVTPGENTLRGMSGPAVNARKTECHRGHALAGYNLVIRRGRRHCRTCQQRLHREYSKRARARKAKERAALAVKESE
jgi:hypothetical protein